MADTGYGEIIPLDIALDNDSMIVYPGTPPYAPFKQSINLHDFNRGLVAIKLVDKRLCFIKPTSETYEEVAERIHHKGPLAPIKQVTEEWTKGKVMIKPEDVESMFGSLIANFCIKYDVYEIDNVVNGRGCHVPEGRQRGKRAAALKEDYLLSCFICGSCLRG